jgi:hypothetical protein
MSILLGIERSLDDRLARGRRSSPRERRKTARPKTGLMVVESMGLAQARDRRIHHARVARRHALVLAADDALGARS